MSYGAPRLLESLTQYPDHLIASSRPVYSIERKGLYFAPITGNCPAVGVKGGNSIYQGGGGGDEFQGVVIYFRGG